MSNSKALAQLKEKRNNLQVLESAQEIAVFSGTLVGILCAGVWLGSFAPKLDARQIAQTGIGFTMTLVGAAWLGHNSTTKKLDENWEEITEAKKPKPTCNGCQYRSSSEALRCAIHPIEQPNNCLDRRSLFDSPNEFKFQDASGLNVVVQNCSESEIEEIKEIVHRVFNSEALPSP